MSFERVEVFLRGEGYYSSCLRSPTFAVLKGLMPFTVLKLNSVNGFINPPTVNEKYSWVNSLEWTVHKFQLLIHPVYTNQIMTKCE